MNRQRMIRWGAGLSLFGLLVVLAALWWLDLLGLKQRQGYFGAVFSPDGAQVYFIERRSAGLHWGTGWEFLSPPAGVYLLSDEFRLQRLLPASGEVATLAHWRGSPLVGQTLRQYRGNLFSALRVGLAVDETGVDYHLSLSLPRQPSAEHFQLRGRWQEAGLPGHWQPERSATPAAGMRVLADRELFDLPGDEGYPAAILMYDHATGHWTALIPAEQRLPAEAVLTALLQHSRKAYVDQQLALAARREQLIEQYRRQGMSTSDAQLAAYRELQLQGYLPRPQRWLAWQQDQPPPAAWVPVAESSSLPRLVLTRPLLQSGLLGDIGQALAAPGTEIDRWPGRYLQHREYEMGETLNRLLADGEEVFEVDLEGVRYQLRLLPAVPVDPARRSSAGG